MDITGFIRPYLCFLVRWLVSCGVRRFDAIYSEPSHYIRREETTFSDGPLIEVCQIRGFEGIHEPESMESESKDALIINVGYDDRLITQVAEAKEAARKIQVFGFPSSRRYVPGERMCTRRATEAVGIAENYFAPANDPFVTAHVLSEIVSDARSRNQLTNLYLCPLATKPQTLGFALYYVNECLDGPCSMLFPSVLPTLRKLVQESRVFGSTPSSYRRTAGEARRVERSVRCRRSPSPAAFGRPVAARFHRGFREDHQ